MVKIMIIFGEYYVAAEDQSEYLLREHHSGNFGTEFSIHSKYRTRANKGRS